MDFIEKNINKLSDDLKKKFLVRFSNDIIKNNAYVEKNGIGTYIYLKKLPDNILYIMETYMKTYLNLNS